MHCQFFRAYLRLIALGFGLSPWLSQVGPRPAVAQTPPPVTLAPPLLPNAPADQVRAAMAAALNRDPATMAIVAMDTRFTTWMDCGVGQLPCKPAPQQGWRVTVRGKNAAGRSETWQYFVNSRDRRVTLDGPASLSATVRRAIARQSQIPLNQLKIRAAQLIQVLPSCPPGALCKRSPIPAWQVLRDGVDVPYTFDLQGQKIPDDFRRLLPKDLAGMPVSYGQQVIEDVRDRSGGQLPANFTVAAVRAVEWNACTGAGDIRPSPMPMGNCPNVTQRAWQVVTQGGPVQWIYYLPRPEVIPGDPIGHAVPLMPLVQLRPDGLQSLPPAVADRVLKLPLPASANSRRLFWADATAFDGCFNPTHSLTAMPVLGGVTQALTCRTIVQPGWQITVHTDGPAFDPISGPMGTPALTYHVTLDGKNTRLINETRWLPPPSAPPPSAPPPSAPPPTLR
jgi:hypothetical protein